MKDDEFRDLVADIRKNGLLEPITMHAGKILDGRHRYRACLIAGVPLEFKNYTGNDAEGFVISANAHRRHLDQDTRRALITAVPKVAPAASNRQVAAQLRVDDKTIVHPKGAEVNCGNSAIGDTYRQGRPKKRSTARKMTAIAKKKKRQLRAP